MNGGAYLYILLCADGSYYIGTTRQSPEVRLAEHNAGLLGGYTATRRPDAMVFCQLRHDYRCHCGGATGQGMVAGEKRGVDQRRMEPSTRIGETPHHAPVGDAVPGTILRDARLRRAPQDEVL